MKTLIPRNAMVAWKAVSPWKMVVIGMAAFGLYACNAWSQMEEAPPVRLPAAVVDETPGAHAGTEVLTLGGGCFWGVQAVFQHLHGVRQAVSGYAGGDPDTAQYRTVSSGITGHAESVEITYDPAQIRLGELLRVYFSVAHNPTELNRQGPDEGSQYRSVIFYRNAEQKRIAEAYIAQLSSARLFTSPIVTQLSAFHGFYPAEGYHQDYATLHPDAGYIAHFDLPKLRHLKQLFPAIYQEQPVLVGAR